MKNIIVFSLVCIFSIFGNLAFGQNPKAPLIMKAFPLKTDAKVYRLARDTSPVIALKKAGSKILVVKEKDQDWMMVQIGGINSYLRKEVINLQPEIKEGYILQCGPYVSRYNPGRLVRTGYKDKGTNILSNRNFRNNSMNDGF